MKPKKFSCKSWINNTPSNFRPQEIEGQQKIIIITIIPVSFGCLLYLFLHRGQILANDRETNLAWFLTSESWLPRRAIRVSIWDKLSLWQRQTCSCDLETWRKLIGNISSIATFPIRASFIYDHLSILPHPCHLKLRWNLHNKINLSKMSPSVALRVFRMLCKYHLYLVPNIFFAPQETPYPLSSHSSSPFPPVPGNYPSVFCL